jgi:hypothetical protein
VYSSGLEFQLLNSNFVVPSFPSIAISPKEGEPDAGIARSGNSNGQVHKVYLQSIRSRFGIILREPVVVRPTQTERFVAMDAQDGILSHLSQVTDTFRNVLKARIPESLTLEILSRPAFLTSF